jgi:hypothetical protein
MKYETQILIGGAALAKLGSSRSTNDTDYLIFDENSFDAFIFDKENNIDYMNGNGSNFAEEIYNIEKNNKIASPQSLFDLKAFAYLSHLRNFNKAKMNDCIFDLNFLANKFAINDIKVLKNYVTEVEREEILKVLI